MILYANQKPNFTYTDMYKIYSKFFEIINDFLCLLKKKHIKTTMKLYAKRNRMIPLYVFIFATTSRGVN